MNNQNKKDQAATDSFMKKGHQSIMETLNKGMETVEEAAFDYADAAHETGEPGWNQDYNAFKEGAQWAKQQSDGEAPPVNKYASSSADDYKIIETGKMTITLPANFDGEIIGYRKESEFAKLEAEVAILREALLYSRAWFVGMPANQYVLEVIDKALKQ